MLTDTQLAQYDEEGAVTVDSPFTTEELDRAEAAWDRLKESGGAPYDDPDFVDFVQHPYLEEMAKKVLRADSVHLWWNVSRHERAPAKPPYDNWRDQWKQKCHVDIQATLKDFEATPRRMRAELWCWLNDVPAHRGAMRILPGSHRTIMDHWGRILQPEHKARLPRVHGLQPAPVPPTAAAFPEYISDIGGTPWNECEPTPAVARRGGVLVLCSAGLHAAWQNEDGVPRKAILISWVAAGLTCGLPKNQRDAVSEFLPRLQRKLRPERTHIVPDNFDWLFESGYEPQWPETFLPSHSA